ncbi:GD10343 [Drosophila simulans]|uniref:GD10343 n=1 Tax=Drosophila simulans TaxID=7240 RepID=B4NV65_DROSI|nr:GD10343 [Drosophila simulans]
MPKGAVGALEALGGRSGRRGWRRCYLRSISGAANAHPPAPPTCTTHALALMSLSCANDFARQGGKFFPKQQHQGSEMEVGGAGRCGAEGRGTRLKTLNEVYESDKVF